MCISNPEPGDVTVQQVAARAGCTVKTVRRAIGGGQLPRRYTPAPRGPRLVLRPAEVERWLSARAAHSRKGRKEKQRAAAPGAPQDMSLLLRRLAALQAEQEEGRALINGLRAELASREAILSDLLATIDALSERLARLMARAAGSGIPAVAGGDEPRGAGAKVAGAPRQSARRAGMTIQVGSLRLGATVSPPP